MRTPIRITAIAGILALATLGVGGASAAPAGTIYDGMPSPQPSNMPSLGYQATQTAEFGDDIAFAAGTRTLQAVNVYMSSWACENWATMNADTPCVTTPGATFNHPITLNFYSVTHVGGVPSGTPVLGALLKSVTHTFAIPYRPSADTTCPSPTQWKDAAGACFNGYGFVISFGLGGYVVPDELVYGIAYNTNTWGANPIGTNGPFESLNVGVTPHSAAGIGTDVNPDLVFWNTGTAGGGTFRPDTGWAANGPAAVQFVASPVVAPTTTTVVGQEAPVPTVTGVLDASGTLPGTGSNSSNGMLIALAVITAGAAITLVARRRNHA